LLRFPAQRLSVIVLCNRVGDLNALALSERVADSYLPPAESPAEATATAAQPTAYAGAYWNAQTFAYLRFVARGDSLALASDDAPQPLHAVGDGVFQADDSTTRYTFHGVDAGMTVDAKDDDSDVLRLERIPADQLPVSNLADFAGTYYSAELGVSWTLAARDGKLHRTQWLFPTAILTPVFADTFTGALSEAGFALRFTRNSAGNVVGFAVATSMVHPLQFRRCPPKPRLDGGPIALGCESEVRIDR